MKINLFLLLLLLTIIGCDKRDSKSVQTPDSTSAATVDSVIDNSNVADTVKNQDSINRVEAVKAFIKWTEEKDKASIAKITSYPFKRAYPIPVIKNEKEFLERFDEVFDDELIQMIVNSDPAKDWEMVGWRGITFGNGLVWLQENGTLSAVNYQSDTEKKIQQEIIEEDRKSVHQSLKDFSKPVCVLKTSGYLIRIDEMANQKYRYASWQVRGKMTDKPDLIIANGEYTPDGSGGNHRCVFKYGNYVYECEIIIIGEEDSPDAILTVYKGEKEILKQPAQLF